MNEKEASLFREEKNKSFCAQGIEETASQQFLSRVFDKSRDVLSARLANAIATYTFFFLTSRREGFRRGREFSSHFYAQLWGCTLAIKRPRDRWRRDFLAEKGSRRRDLVDDPTHTTESIWKCDASTLDADLRGASRPLRLDRIVAMLRPRKRV